MANNNLQAQEIESLNMKEAFFMKNKKAIIIAVVALVVIIAGVFGYFSQIAGPREDKASTLLGKGQTYFQNEMFVQALNGDGAGYVGFAKIASEYSSTKAGNLANLYAGLCYANLGKWAEAEKSLDAFSSKDDQMISPAAQAALGDVMLTSRRTTRLLTLSRRLLLWPTARLRMMPTMRFLLHSSSRLVKSWRAMARRQRL